MNKIYIKFYKHKYAHFILGSFDDKLCLLDFRYRKSISSIENRLKKYFNAEFIEQDNDILLEAIKQLDEYFQMRRSSFDIPIITAGSEFQNKVWQALLEVPYGTTTSYLQLSKDINNEKAVRAVANANGANAIAIIIPCHRVIGSNGKLVGFGGGLPMKEKLLELERNLFLK
jgi:methylated-DNA-[protein]-cysteine S-methyltransferase